MKPHLTTSASPDRNSASGSPASASVSAQHGGRRVEGAHQVLAGGGVDAGLAADRGVDHAEQAGRHLHHAHPAQPGGGQEAGQVGDRSPADADDGVGPGQPEPAELLPGAGGDLGGLGRLPVGDDDGLGRHPGCCSVSTAAPAAAASDAAVHHGGPGGAVEHQPELRLHPRGRSATS